MGFVLGREASGMTTWWTLWLHCHFLLSFKRSFTTMFLRVLEIIFFLYFATHIPISLFIDLQALLPGHVYPQQVGVTNSRIVLISHFYMLTVFPFCSWKMFFGGILRSSKTQWWWTRQSGSSPSFSVRPSSSCPSSPLQHTPFWKVSENSTI